ncbi:uncharacterized protein FIBRA_08618 [Fibroporia radiculosa]|uniref:Uncharacterized protein n=1 Tax=Fibroporia radiculosa TaxID=599839 RepID=J4ICG3_9APHY|nr:uncharacterized protein FIBRA_08618 [Fibroporia radiculosa]CCM06361.1 predicted protein [Fibroporia radiculosa]
MSSSPIKFPSPVGGVPFSHDFDPSIVFIVFFALCLPVAVYRLMNQQRRTYIIISVMFFCIERVINFSLRAAEARSPVKRTERFYVTYLQGAYGTGFIGLGQALTVILRAYLVYTTRGEVAVGGKAAPFALSSRSDTRLPLTEEYAISSDAGVFQPLPMSPMEDDPDRRMQIRRLLRIISFVYWVAVILSAVSGGLYWSGITDSNKGKLVQQTRYASTIIVLLQLQATNAIAIWAWKTRPRSVQSSRVLLISFFISILSIVAMYRLAVMANETTALLSTTRASLNMPSEKTAFYVLHIAPEGLVAVALLLLDMKGLFCMGMKGDTALNDNVQSQ